MSFSSAERENITITVHSFELYNIHIFRRVDKNPDPTLHNWSNSKNYYSLQNTLFQPEMNSNRNERKSSIISRINFNDKTDYFATCKFDKRNDI